MVPQLAMAWCVEQEELWLRAGRGVVFGAVAVL